MGDEYVNIKDVINIAAQYCPDDDGSCSKADVDLREMLDEIEALPAADVQPVKFTTNNSAVAHCDKFICRECGICLQDWARLEAEEYEDGYIDYTHHEYEFKFCPECGAKVKDGDIDNNTRNLTDEETDIYNSWLEAEAETIDEIPLL